MKVSDKGWHHSDFRIHHYLDTRGKSAYRLWTSNRVMRFKLARSAPVSICNILSNARWGNFTRQIVGATSTARIFSGTRCVVVSHSTHWLPAHFSIGDIRLFNGLAEYKATPLSRLFPTRILRGSFFDLSAVSSRYPTLSLKSDQSVLFRQLSEVVFDRLRSIVYSVHDTWRADILNMIKERDCLVVYLRGGDIFEEGGVNRSYGQPPLAYYQQCVDFCSPRSVVIVSQDDANPCWSALGAWLMDKDINVTYVSSEFSFDYYIQMAAAKVVLSISSNNALLLARRASQLASSSLTFIYEPKQSLLGLRGSAGSVVIATDSVGTYRQKMSVDGWSRSEMQLKMMTSYPVKNILLSHSERKL